MLLYFLNSISYEAPLKLVISPPVPINIRNSWVSGLRRTSHTGERHVSGPISVDEQSEPPSPGSDMSSENNNNHDTRNTVSESARNMMYFNPNAKKVNASNNRNGNTSKSSSNPRVPLAAESTVEVSEATVL